MFTKMHGAVGGGTNLEPVDVQLASGAYLLCSASSSAWGAPSPKRRTSPPEATPWPFASHSWWKRRFARDPAVVGKTVTLGSTVYTIIGVTPPEFFGTTMGQSPDLWIPLSMDKQVSPGWNGLDDRWFHSLYILARLINNLLSASSLPPVLTLPCFSLVTGPLVTSLWV